MPIKDDLIEYYVFSGCPKLTTVDLVGGINNTVASLHLERWKNEMKDEINNINQVLPTIDDPYYSMWDQINRPFECIPSEAKTAAIQQWMSSVVSRLDHYKALHKTLLKEATTLLELALWKSNLDDNEGRVLEREGVRTTRGRRKRARKEICVTSGSNIVIKNVLPFLELE